MMSLTKPGWTAVPSKYANEHTMGKPQMRSAQRQHPLLGARDRPHNNVSTRMRPARFLKRIHTPHPVPETSADGLVSQPIVSAPSLHLRLYLTVRCPQD